MPQAWGNDGFTFAIRFSRTSADGVLRTAYLDNVVLTQVPEPSALALACLGLIGLGLWRRKARAGRSALFIKATLRPP